MTPMRKIDTFPEMEGEAISRTYMQLHNHIAVSDGHTVLLLYEQCDICQNILQGPSHNGQSLWRFHAGIWKKECHHQICIFKSSIWHQKEGWDAKGEKLDAKI